MLPSSALFTVDSLQFYEPSTQMLVAAAAFLSDENAVKISSVNAPLTFLNMGMLREWQDWEGFG
jgi:hypothetical protein